MTYLEVLILRWKDLLEIQVNLLTIPTQNLIRETIAALTELKELKGE